MSTNPEPEPNDQLLPRASTQLSRQRADLDEDEISERMGELLQKMDELIGKTAIEMQQMNTSGTFRGLQLGKRLADQAAAIAPDSMYVFRHLLGFLEMLHGVGQIVKPQMEADYDAALEACRSTNGMFERQIAMAREFAEKAPDGFRQVLFASELEPFYTGMLAVIQAIENSIQGEQHLYRGDIRGYLHHARLAYRYYQESHESMALCDFVMFAVIRDIFSAQSNLLRRRLNTVEKDFSLRSRYIVPSGTEVFVVHGHDYANRDALVQMLDGWGLTSSVLVEEANAGRTVIQKFEQAAERCRYAIILLTPDDFVTNPATPAPYGQARANVLFEFGWFFGRYGPGCVCVLVKKGMPIPSDVGGVIFLEFEASVTEPKCRDALLVELRHAKVLKR